MAAYMAVNDRVPRFGSLNPSATYVDRPAAYAVILNEPGQVAAVTSLSGHYFLPGGGSLPTETAELTLVREVAEELAQGVRILARIGAAEQLFRVDGCDYRMQAVFFRGMFTGSIAGTPEHTLLWLSPREFEGRCFHACHAWAIHQALR